MNNTTTDTRQNRPPRALATDVEDAVFVATTGAAAASADIWAGYTADDSSLTKPQGMCWIELEAFTTNVCVRFTRTALTATTTSNGACVTVGTPRRFFVDPRKDLFIDHLATGAGLLKWRRVGHIVERTRQ
jgi:hypothetical protein